MHELSRLPPMGPPPASSFSPEASTSGITVVPPPPPPPLPDQVVNGSDQGEDLDLGSEEAKETPTAEETDDMQQETSSPVPPSSEPEAAQEPQRDSAFSPTAYELKGVESFVGMEGFHGQPPPGFLPPPPPPPQHFEMTQGMPVMLGQPQLQLGVNGTILVESH